MTPRYSITDFIFNRPKKPLPFSSGIFRTVPGRLTMPSDAAPVRVMNKDGFGLTLSTFTLATANQEYNIQGIATMSAIVVKARGGPVQMSVYEGQSNSVYSLIADGQALEISTIPFAQIDSPVSIYVRSTTAGCVVELLGLSLIDAKNGPALAG